MHTAKSESPGVVFDHVWKKFRRGEVRTSLRDLVPALARRMLGRRVADDVAQEGEFWALNDVSFTVSNGEALGIIGPNGAGKSTVLKVLTGILRSTRGECTVRGRVGALIEVAAGFHPDLTGRENVYLQGAIMGMRKVDIRRKFDDIVDFSGIGEFLDTPVKRYSSGMNARLGFSIAAHLDPDVLIIDEVLAVGDIAFQGRAFGRIRELVRSDIPVIVVSHQLDRIAELCTSAILLNQGRVVHRGDPNECIRRYMEPLLQDSSAGVNGGPVIRRLELISGTRVRSGDRICIRIEAVRPGRLDAEMVDPVAIVVRSGVTGAVMAAISTTTCGVSPPTDRVFHIETSLQMNVPAGIYLLETLVWDRKTHTALEKGPSTVVVVEEGAVFVGQVQLNARMELAAV
jgi:ABC-type polysaccharide/polyol phosphate transport system ATPase subunit